MGTIFNGKNKLVIFLIPKIIWQTYESKYEDLSPIVKEYCLTWKEKNPTWEYRYMDSEEREKFVLEYFGSEWLEIFKSYPFGVIRANIWRYMVLYVYGGVYTDIDTICNDPLESWVDDKYSMIVSGDDGGEDFCFYVPTFAAENGSIFLKSIIDLAKDRHLNNKNIDYSNIFSIFYYSGALLFTDGIVNALDNSLNVSYNKDYREYNNTDNAKKYKFLCYGGEDSRMLIDGHVKHIDASIHWDSSFHIKWREEVKNYGGGSK